MKSTTSLGGKLGGMPSLASFGKGLGSLGNLGGLAKNYTARMSVKMHPVPKMKKPEEMGYAVSEPKRTDYSKPTTIYEKPAYGNTPIGFYRDLKKPQVYMTAGVVGYSGNSGRSYAPQTTDYVPQSGGYNAASSAGYVSNIVQFKDYKQDKDRAYAA